MSTQDTQSGLSDEDLALLTEEEREAIAAGAEDAAQQEALAKIAAGADDDDDDDDDDGDGKDKGEDAAAAQAAAAAAATPPAAEDGAAAAAQAPSAAPADKPAAKPATYSAELPADFEAQQQAVATELADLRRQFKDGALEIDDYEDRREALLQQRDDLNRLSTKAEIAAEMRTQTAEQQWEAAIARAFDDAAKPEGGAIDYRTDKAKAADLDQFVRLLGSNPDNAEKDMDWFLQEGHRRVKALHGVAPAPAAAAAAAAPTPPPTRRAPVESAPKTLAMVPGADGPGDVAGEFADVDALDGDELEAAIARMSPAQREKFERGR